MSLTNPDPEIEPEVALAHGALVALDGKSVNNMLAFPGLFRGALDAEASHISQAMKIAAAVRLAELAPDRALVANGIDKTLHQQVAAAVFDAAKVTN